MRKLLLLLWSPLLALTPAATPETTQTIRSIKIGDDTWTATNLDVAKYRNGDAIPQVTDPEKWKKLKTGAWCWYNNDQKNGQKFGRLYNWYAVNDKRGLAPAGWHVATRAEWDRLTDTLGGPEHAAMKMKERGTWNETGNPYDNTSGFSAKAGGGRYNGRYLSVSFNANFWTADDSTSTIAHARFISASSDAVFASSYDKPWGYSVRCVKD